MGMADIKRGESIFIPFRNGTSIYDSQCKPRMYKTIKGFEKHFPSRYLGNDGIELVEYAEVVHGQWIPVPSSDMMTGKAYKCSECGKMRYGSHFPNFCQCCGADMRERKDND